MLDYLESSEDPKVSLGELKKMGTPEEAGFSSVQVAQPSRNERGQRLFETFRQGGNEVYIASLARWDTQLGGLAERERRCQDMTQEVKLSRERQEVLTGLVEDKIRLQSKATEKYTDFLNGHPRPVLPPDSRIAQLGLLVRANPVLSRAYLDRP